MAEVLISREERPRSGTTGLRRNRSSGSLHAGDKRAMDARHSSRNSQKNLYTARIQTEEHNAHQAQHIYSRPPTRSTSRSTLSSSTAGSGTSSGLRKSLSETAISQARQPAKSKKDRISLRTRAQLPKLDREQNQAPPSSPLSRSPPTKSDGNLSRNPSFIISEDDLAIKEEPNKRVDYLSHPWTVQELSDSWRYVVSNRSVFGQLSRLENSAWRCWWKTMGGLKTLDPEKLNWYKDNDVTWLYGPLQTPTTPLISHTPSEPPSSLLSKTNSFLTKKSILKKRSMSEILLQKSLSNSSLLRQAATAAQLQQYRPNSYGRRQSDFTPAIMSTRIGAKDYLDCVSSSSTSGQQTPSESGKHIQFAEQVEQCIAVNTKGIGDEDDDAQTYIEDDYWSGDENFLFMKNSRHKGRFQTHRPQRRHSAASEQARMIEILPATTLNDTPKSEIWSEGPSHSLQIKQHWHPHGQLLPSPSAETLRPKNPAKNFLIHDPTEDFMDNSENSSDEENSGIDEEQMLQTAQEEAEKQRGLRRTGSGMLMPASGSEADDPAFGGLVGTILDTVNTARDIAHVVWNVGWRR